MRPDDRFRRIAAEAGLRFVDLDPHRRLGDPVAPEVARLLAPEIARRYEVIAIEADAATITVATPRSATPALANLIERATGRAVRFVIATPVAILRAQQRHLAPLHSGRRRRFRPPDALPAVEVAFQRRLAASAGLEFSELPPEEVDPESAHLLGEQVSRRLGVIALSATLDSIRVAVAQPFDERTLRLVEAVTGLRPVQVVSPTHAIAAAHELAFTRRHRSGDPLAADRSAAPQLRLGELLLQQGRVDRPALRRALAVQRRTGDPLGRILVAGGAISEDQLAEAVAGQLKVPYVSDAAVAPALAAAGALPIAEAVCRRHRLLPLEFVDGTLVVAMADPYDPSAAAVVRTLPHPTRVVVTTDSTISANLQRLHAELYTEISTTELLRRRPDESAHEVLSYGQKVVGIALLALLAVGGIVAIVPTLILLTVLSVAFYSASALYKFALAYRTIGHTYEVPVTEAEISLLDEHRLPHYTILVPLYHEDIVARQLIAALDRLDYPKAKLDVKLLLEEDDVETRAAVREAQLGAHYSVVIVPDSLPKTKPKACNYGLLHARGDYVVIYDAEDVPEPNQLKKAVAAFRKAPPGIVCVQAKLNYHNREQNLLTRWFTAEYSQWFDLFLPALDATGAPIPLGGTSNHFALPALLELGAWDPFNVTEDADLGIRLARAGLRTAIIDSTTYEEATSGLHNWIRQRSRWVKGYIQTWLVHMRHPGQLWRELGPLNFLSFQLVVGGTFLTMLLNPIFWGLTSLWALTEAGVIRQIFPGFIYYLGSLNLLIGNFVFTYLNVLGALRRGYDDLVRYALFSPLYWALMSVGAWRGLIQLITRPSYWEKTNHGLTPAPDLPQ